MIVTPNDLKKDSVAVKLKDIEINDLQDDVFRACLPYEYVLYTSAEGENLLKG
jgi:hypothetical protein